MMPQPQTTNDEKDAVNASDSSTDDNFIAPLDTPLTEPIQQENLEQVDSDESPVVAMLATQSAPDQSLEQEKIIPSTSEDEALIAAVSSAPSIVVPKLPDPFEPDPEEETKKVTTTLPLSLYKKLKYAVELEGITMHALTLSYFMNYERYKLAYDEFGKMQTELSKAISETLRLTLENDQLRQRLQDQPTDNAIIDELQANNGQLANEVTEARQMVLSLQTQLKTSQQLVTTGSQQREEILRVQREADEAKQAQAASFQEMIVLIIDKAAAMPTGEVIAPTGARRKELRSYAADLFDKLFN